MRSKSPRAPVPVPRDLLPIIASVLQQHAYNAPNGCIEWTGYRYKRGYGHLVFTVSGKRYSFLAHRAAYVVAHPAVSDDLFICHSCDNPPCFNAAHLFAGSHSDNIADAVAKHRHRHGESHSFAVLTEAQVIDARARYGAHEMSQDQLAARLGVSRQTMQEALVGETWRHVPGAIIPGTVHKGRKLSADDVGDVRRWAADGIRVGEIARRFGVNSSLISMIVSGKRHKATSC